MNCECSSTSINSLVKILMSGHQQKTEGLFHKHYFLYSVLAIALCRRKFSMTTVSKFNRCQIKSLQTRSLYISVWRHLYALPIINLTLRNSILLFV